MADDLTPQERRELDEFVAHLQSLPDGDLEIVETRVYHYPSNN